MNDIFTTAPTSSGYTLPDYRLQRMVLSPTHWQRLSWPHLTTWRSIAFNAKNVDQVPPDKRGVYTFVVKPGIAGHTDCAYLLYVGMVKDQYFRDRYRQYLQEQSAGDKSRRVHVTQMLLKWDGFLWFCYAPLDDQAAIITAEDALLAAYLPPCNRRFPATVEREIKKLFAQ